jgi:hypothetical protein
MSDLGIKAGYPKNFFSGHSLRTGFVNQLLVNALAQGKSLSSAIVGIATAGGWSCTDRSAVTNYVSGPLHNVFVADLHLENVEQACKDMSVEMWHGEGILTALKHFHLGHAGVFQYVRDFGAALYAPVLGKVRTPDGIS